MFTNQDRAKDPAVANAEKFMNAVMQGDINSIYNMMDPKILLNGTMGVFQSRPHVKAWLQFEHSVLEGAPVIHHGTQSVDGLKIANSTWSVYGLHFTDVITLNQVLSIRTIKRTMRREYKNEKEKELSEALLLAWTGPYFSKYCGKRVGGVDNRALVLPVLDYAYMGLQSVRDLLTVKPNGGREIQENSIVFHFLHTMSEKEKEAEAQEKQQTEKEKVQAEFGHKKDEVTIRAKGRDGEAAAIVIDKTTLADNSESRVDSLEDGEVNVKEDRMRFVCSGIKLCNNGLKDCRELDIVLKLYLVNSFYFLSMMDLSSNNLTEIPDLSQFPLQTLYLHANNISDAKEADKLKGLTQLTSLTLFGNPIQERAKSAKDYKYRVLAMFWHPPAPKPPRSRSPPKTPFEKAQETRDRLAGSESSSRVGSAAPGARKPPFAAGIARKRDPSPGPIKKIRPPSAAQMEVAKREKLRLEKGYVSLRQLDHSVISPIEAEAVERFVNVFESHSRPSSRAH